MKDVLSVLPGIIQEFDRNVFNAHDEVILQCMVRGVETILIVGRPN